MRAVRTTRAANKKRQQHPIQSMKTTATHRAGLLAGLTLALLLNASSTLRAEGQPQGVPRKTAVTGNFDWSLVPPNLGPYLIPGTDGDLYVRHLPLAGKFTLAGKGVALEAKIHVDLNMELDVTGTGVVWGTTVITATIDGAKTIIFEGSGSADTVGLVSIGTMTLSGRGPFAGRRLEFTFEEIGPGNSDTYTLRGQLAPEPQR